MWKWLQTYKYVTHIPIKTMILKELIEKIIGNYFWLPIWKGRDYNSDNIHFLVYNVGLGG